MGSWTTLSSFFWLFGVLLDALVRLDTGNDAYGINDYFLADTP